MIPVAVMKCPKCRFGIVYKYETELKCERCGYTEATVESVPTPKLQGCVQKSN